MISIIIPVYNGGRFIQNCYQSLINQTYQNWEVIFINDGSSDNSHEILLKLSVLDSRIRVINKENEGVAIAREVGIKEAKGEYITFLDVDDTLVDTALEQFVKAFDTICVDIVFAGINIISESGDLIRKIHYSPIIISGTKATEYLCTGKLRWQLCGKAFKTELFFGINTPSGLRSAEDMAVCLQTTVKSSKIKILKSCLYNYVQVTSSVTHSKAREISYDALMATQFVEQVVGNKINSVSLDCLFLLIISSALRAGISVKDMLFRTAVLKHGKLKSIYKLPLQKAINVGLYRYCNINLARFL